MRQEALYGYQMPAALGLWSWWYRASRGIHSVRHSCAPGEDMREMVEGQQGVCIERNIGSSKVTAISCQWCRQALVTAHEHPYHALVATEHMLR